jgi:hypothetical protein
MEGVEHGELCNAIWGVMKELMTDPFILHIGFPGDAYLFNELIQRAILP